MGILLLIALTYFGWRYYETKAIWDESDIAGKFEFSLNEILARHHIMDADIAKTLRTERKSAWPLPISWIETDREIFASSQKAELILTEIESLCAKSNFSLKASRAVKNRMILECGKNTRIFQRIIFLIAILLQLKLLYRLMIPDSLVLSKGYKALLKMAYGKLLIVT